METFTFADLSNPISHLSQVMSLNCAVVDQMVESAEKLKKLNDEVKDYLKERGSATAEELDDKFFGPMNSIMEELSDLFF